VSQKTTLVLAQEEALFRDGLISIFEAAGRFRVLGQCGDGRTAAKMIEAMSPDIAILDLGLPRLHSLAVIRRCLAGGSRTKFLVVSPRIESKAVLNALRAGANGFLLRSDGSALLLRGLRDIQAGSIFISPQLKLVNVFRGDNAPREAHEGLSPREYQVFMLVVHGLRGKEIAARLDLSEKTVSTYRTLMMKKLGVHDIPALVRYAVRQRILPLR
jgi:DNA-binding NarL/FixJ family response regulator